MAKFTRKIKKNIDAPRIAAEEEAKDIAASQPHNQQFRSWEVYVIAGIMALTLFLVADQLIRETLHEKRLPC